jgi:hypothetical protein
MSAAETIFEKAKALPDDQHIEALNFVNLISRELAEAESSDWAAFSGNQLSCHYCHDDAIFDKD